MKKVLLALAAALLFFVLMVVVFFLIFFFTGEEQLADVEAMVSGRELLAVIQQRDSLQADIDSLQALLAVNNTARDDLGQELAIRDATVKVLEDRLQDKDAEITSLRQVDVSAQEMARTFATMSVAELQPIVVNLGDDVVLDIYKHTTNKRRKFLLTALGNERAAALTNRLVKRKGS